MTKPFENRRVIVISVDGLSPAAIEPYGCSWQSTPSLCKIASESLVFDRFIADSLSSRSVLQSLVLGRHHLARDVTGEPRAFGAGSAFITDSDSHALDGSGGEGLPLSGIEECFDEQIVVPYSIPSSPALAVEETAISDLFAPAIEIACDRRSRFMWLHVSSLARCWDVPRLLCEVDDEVSMLEDTRPPKLNSDDECDPDQLVALMNLYGGQVRLLDLMLGLLFDAVMEEPEFEDTMIVVAGTSSFHLGENSAFGFETGPPTSARIQLPLLIWRAGVDPMRSRHIRQPGDLRSGLEGWLDGEGGGILLDGDPERWAGDSSPTDWAITAGSDSSPAAFTTPCWLLHQAEADTQMFLKPDDRFDVNDVSRRVPMVWESMETQALQATESLRQGGERHRLTDEVLSGQW